MGVPEPKPGPQLAVSDVAPVVAFYTQVFDAVPVERECLLDGRVLHAELIVGGYRLTASEWYDGLPAGEQPAVLTVTQDDPQLLLTRALAAGATLEPPVEGLSGVVFRDPAGQRWEIVGASRP